MSDDVFIVQRGVTGKGVGNDIYIFSGELLDSDSTVTISDTEGNNRIQLIDGLNIVSSVVASNTVRLTLSNGTVVDILDASHMVFELGGDPVSGNGGVEKTYTSFVQDVLGSLVPNDGAPVNSGGAITIDSSTLSPDPVGLVFTDADATGSVDELKGTGGDDVITATAGLTDSNATLDSGDTLVDGNLDDNDTLTIAATTDVQEMASLISGIENINFDLTSFTDLTVDLSGIVGFGSTITLRNLQAAGATGVTVTNVPGSATVIAGSGVTGVFTAALEGKNATLDATAVTTTHLTQVDDGGVTLFVTNGATVTLDGTVATTDLAAIEGVGAISLETQVTNQVEGLTLSGSTGSVVFTLDATDDLPLTLSFDGDQNVTLALTVDQLAALTVTDVTDSSATTSVRLNTAGTADLTNVDVDTIEINDGSTSGTYTVANMQDVLLLKDATASGLTLDASLASGSETLDLQITTSQSGGNLTVSDFEVVNLAVSGSAIAINNLVGDGTTTTVNATGDQHLTLTAVTASGINGTGMTGNLTVTLADTMMSATGGSGDDVFIAWDGNMTVDGGSGTDTLRLIGAQDLSDNTLYLSNLDALHITDDAAVSVTINASEVHAKTMALKGTGTQDTFILNMDESILDLSNSSVDNATAKLSIVSTSVAVTQLTITASSGQDTITAGTQNDTITAGEGADTVSGGAGNDSIILTETTAAVDQVVISAASSNGIDTITGFSVSNDQIALQASDLTADSATASGTALKATSETTALITGGGAFALAASTTDFSVVELTTVLDDDVALSATSTGTDLLQALSSDATAVSGITVNSANAEAYLLVYQNNNAYLWHLEEGRGGTLAGDTAVLAGDIMLVGVFDTIVSGAMLASSFVAA